MMPVGEEAVQWVEKYLALVQLSEHFGTFRIEHARPSDHFGS
jgi:hypothetical protein